MKHAGGQLDGRIFAFLLLVVTLLAAFLRFSRLDEPSFWSDELFQLRDALLGRRSGGYLETLWALQLTGLDTAALQSDGYASWRSQGLTEWHARLAAAGIGTLSVPALAALSATFLGRPTALILGLLLAINSWHLDWSQTARFYIPLFLYYNGALALYFAGAVRSSAWTLAVAMALAVLAVNTRATSLMLFAVIGIDVAYRLIRCPQLPLRGRQLAILLAGGLVCAFVAKGPLLGIAAAPDRLLPFTERPLGVSPFRLVATNVYLSGLPLCLLASAAPLLLRRSDPRLTLFLTAAVLVPLVSFALLSFFVHVQVRYTFVSVYAWTALAAAGAWSAHLAARAHLSRAVSFLPLALVVATTVVANLVYYESAYGSRPRWRHAFEYVRDHRAPGDTVIAPSSWVGEYYIEDEVLHIRYDFEDLEQLRSNTWFVVKSTKYELGEGRPHWLDPEADDGYVRQWKPAVMGPNRHLGYAIQWFAFAATAFLIYLVLTLRKPNPNDGQNDRSEPT